MIQLAIATLAVLQKCNLNVEDYHFSNAEKMTVKFRLFVLIFWSLFLAIKSNDLLAEKAAFMEAGMDISADPCEDFWTFATGKIDKKKLADQHLLEADAVLAASNRSKVRFW
uniref:Uncharacterized protein n=1 Tax=Bursaphelenchus xylophilus TaxID=6326 RepID=A0A1I7SNN8_BURXY